VKGKFSLRPYVVWLNFKCNYTFTEDRREGHKSMISEIMTERIILCSRLSRPALHRVLSMGYRVPVTPWNKLKALDTSTIT